MFNDKISCDRKSYEKFVDGTSFYSFGGQWPRLFNESDHGSDW